MTNNEKITDVSEVFACLIYNPETGEFFWKKTNSNRCKAGSKAGTLGLDGYSVVTIKRKRLRAHRLAWLFHTGSWPEKHIDHINGIKTDNRISNLRQVTGTENQGNRRKASSYLGGKTASIHKGVYKAKNGKWRSYIRYKTENIYVGTFITEMEAKKAYDLKAIELFGDYSSVSRGI